MVPPAVVALTDAVSGMRGLDLELLSSGQLLETLEAVETLARQLQAVGIRQLRCAHERDVTAAECGRSPRSWLIEEQNLSPAEASRRMRLLHALPSHPLLEAAVDAGDISAEHALTILTALRHVPAELLDAVEDALVELAGQVPPHEVARAVDAILVALGVESSADEAAARRYGERGVTNSRTFAGTGSLAGTLTPELAEKLDLVFAGCANRAGEDDERSAAARRHDTLEEILDHWLGSAELPDVNGERPRLVVTISWDDLMDTLTTGRWATFDSGALLNPAAARRIGCDAEILPVLLGSRSELLDIVETTRTFTAKVKRAIRIRDGNRCGFPRCRRPLAECHHIIHWADGGPSTADNGVYLCAFHHWLAHEGGWNLARNPNGSHTWTNTTGRTITGQPPPRQPKAA